MLFRSYTNNIGLTSYLTLGTNDPGSSTNSATWTPTIPVGGTWEVDVFVPNHAFNIWPCGENPQYDTNSAKYFISYDGGSVYQTLNQEPLTDVWVSLGQYNFAAGSTGYLKLTDITSDANLTRFVSFSAARFVLVTPYPTMPGSLSKSAPTNGTTINSTSPSISWGASSGAASYEYCIDTTNDSACTTTWTTVGSSTSANLSGLANNTTYYWLVRARNAAGVTNADGGTWWSFITPTQVSNCTPIWQATITVKDNGQTSGGLTIGQGPDATDAIDNCYGEAMLPPSPPTGTFNARLALPGGVQESVKDFRASSQTTPSWTMKFQPSSGGYPITFTWNPSQLPTGNFILKDTITGTIVNVNMKVNSSYTLTNSGISSLQIVLSGQCTDISIVVGQGWNMVSMPGNMNNMSLISLFPDVTAPAYKYANGYQTVSETTQLSAGTGYWMYFNTSHTYPMCITPAVSRDITVTSGWNMVGAFDAATNVTAIVSTPVNILGPQIYTYQAGYSTVTSLQPGKGYWAYASKSGTINLNGITPAAFSSENTVSQPQSCTKSWQMSVSTTDNGQGAGTITIGQALGATDGIDTCYGETMLPPTPPLGVFDNRLMLPGGTQESLADFRSNVGTNFVWTLKFQPSNAGYPIHLSWNIADMPSGSFYLMDNLGGSVVNVDMKTQNGYTLSNTNITTLLIVYTPSSPLMFSIYLPLMIR